jgi:hypothetical protein
MVVYSELSPDRTVSLYLNQTYPPTGKFTVKKGLEGARVSLSENGVFKETLVYADSGIYRSPSGFKPKVGFSYSFEVTLEGYPDVSTAPVLIPSEVLGITLQLERDSFPSLNVGNIARKLEVSWLDRSEEKNDYLVTIEGNYQKQNLGAEAYLLGKNGEIEDGCSFSRNLARYVFRDVCSTTERIKATFAVETFGFIQDPNFSSGGSRRRNVEEYRIRIANMSDSYLRFLRDGVEPFELFLAFQLPQSRFSNVNNGHGVVIGYNETVFVLDAR